MKVARWTLQHDPNTTRACYAQVAQGSPAARSCIPCRNFASAFDRAYPPEARAVFNLLGIDYQKAAEVYLNGRLESGLYHYGGWFHFVGSIESGSEALQPSGTSTTSFSFHLEALSEHFFIGFSSQLGLVREPFHDHSLVQLEFTTEIPWIISDPEPS